MLIIILIMMRVIYANNLLKCIMAASHTES